MLLGFFPLQEKGRTFHRPFPARGSNSSNGFPVLSVAFNKEALLVSNPLSGSAERHSYLSELVLFSPPHALCLHQCTLALRLSQPLGGDLFPVRKGETGSNSKGHRDQLQQGWSEHTIQTNVNTGVTIVLMDRL